MLRRCQQVVYESFQIETVAHAPQGYNHAFERADCLLVSSQSRFRPPVRRIERVSRVSRICNRIATIDRRLHTADYNGV